MGGAASKVGALLAAVLGVVVLIVMVIVPATDEDAACGPAPGPAGQGVTGPTGVTLAGLGEQQLQLARNMVAIGRARNMPDSVILSELMAAATESTYRNLSNTNVPESASYPNDGAGSDHDSVGPHQVRVSLHGGGDLKLLMDPVWQINWYYDKAQQVPGYETMDPAVLAQEVERSGPNAYAGQAALARQVFDAFRDVAPASTDPARQVGASTPSAAPGCPPGSGGGPGFVPGGPFGQNVVAAAMRWLGTPYAWGGGTVDGPSLGITDGGVADSFGDYNKVGFDCSGLVLYAVAQASGHQITLPHLDEAQIGDSRGQAITDPAALQPGDIIQPHSGHIFIWIGNGQVVEAPQSGDVVKVSPYTPNGNWKARRFGGGTPNDVPAQQD